MRIVGTLHIANYAAFFVCKNMRSLNPRELIDNMLRYVQFIFWRDNNGCEI